jgi:hypothetical protein
MIAWSERFPDSIDLSKASKAQREALVAQRKAEGMDPREYCQTCGAVFERGADGICNSCNRPYDRLVKGGHGSCEHRGALEEVRDGVCPICNKKRTDPLAKDMDCEGDAPEEGMDDMGGSDMLKSAAAAWFAAYPPPTRW